MQRNDILHMCVQNLMRRKSRTILTVFGVLAGCCSIIIMISIGIGSEEQQEAMPAQQLVLGGIGAVSLLAAAFGIMNTMIMSISERTREIGVMKALGCCARDIRTVFLTEAGAIGLAGGLAGCFSSFVVSIIINLASMGAPPDFSALLMAAAGGDGITRVSVIPVWLFLLAVVFSIAIGLGSGCYPANRAVKISALEAIKPD